MKSQKKPQILQVFLINFFPKDFLRQICVRKKFQVFVFLKRKSSWKFQGELWDGIIVNLKTLKKG